MVFQQFTSSASDGAENVMFGRYARGANKKREKLARELLAKVGLAERASLPFRTFWWSTACGVARALAVK